MTVAVHDSPIGPLTLASEGGALVGVWFPNAGGIPDVENERDAVIDRTRRELDEYFAGTRREFTVPVAPEGTPFQRKVWSALQRVAYGTTTSYGAIAAKIGSPAAVRAVGAANGANPIPIIIPCHRIIGANGSLTGFGGGMERKRFLLDLESGAASLL
ncbi:MAG TPA: methylated-DNA--[protein]-cysteine S-methyltransferase [Gemmatimonadaceae bacterium]|nr:methylated-DNA--[protein]-cysteine S-methyltransferase [Gemmatimonadaceae bacterium]